MARLALLLSLLALAPLACGGDDGSSSTPALKDPGGARTSDDGGDRGEDGAEGGGDVADDLLGPPDAQGDDDARDEGAGEENADANDASGEAPAEPGEPDDEKDRSRSRDGAPAEERGGRARGESLREIERARASVRALVGALAQGDGSACTRLMTQRYVEDVTGRRGDAALARCREQISSQQIDTEWEAWGPAEIKGSRAVVRARVRVAERHFPFVYDLRRGRDGQWKVNARLA